MVTGPSPQTWKKIMKKGFIDGNYLTGPELALYSSLPQIAIKNKIKLIFWEPVQPRTVMKKIQQRKERNMT